MVGQVEGAGQQVGKLVGWSRYALADGVVRVVPLVEGQEPEEERFRPSGGGGTAMLPMDGGLIIAEGNDGLTSKRTDVGEYV